MGWRGEQKIKRLGGPDDGVLMIECQSRCLQVAEGFGRCNDAAVLCGGGTGGGAVVAVEGQQRGSHGWYKRRHRFWVAVARQLGRFGSIFLNPPVENGAAGICHCWVQDKAKELD